MKAIDSLRLTAFVVGIAAAQPALAAPCSGFTDVDDASVFCPNVDWLRNRAVTLGCTSATLFCPADLVSRLSMAAFMNRLGVALTPEIAYSEAAGTTFDLDSPPAAVCPTASIAPATFPRAAHAGALLTAQIPATPAIVAMNIVQSIDNGASWTVLNTLPASVGGSAKWVNAAVSKGDVPLDPGTAYQFGLRVERAASGGTGDLTSWNCQVEVMVTSRTGNGFPY